MALVVISNNKNNIHYFVYPYQSGQTPNEIELLTMLINAICMTTSHWTP